MAAPEDDNQSETNSQRDESVRPASESPDASQSSRPTSPDSAAGAQEMLTSLAEKASQVVQSSARILEEEIAAGILAAKQVEAKFLNVETLRGGDRDRFSRKLRRDVHEIVDILVDLIEAGVKGAGGLAQRAVRLRPGKSNGAGRPVPGNIPTLISPTPLEPGGMAEISMMLENDSDTETNEFDFRSSDLINAASGDRIPAQHVEVSPLPVVIGPKATSNVTVHVKVPAGTAPGVYSGLLQATRLTQLRAIITVRVN